MSDSVNNGNFRTSLHGFNREDVVSFIESKALEQEKEKRLLRDSNAALQAELDEARAALAAVPEVIITPEELAQAKEQVNYLTEENRSLKEQLARQQEELTRQQEQLSRQQEEGSKPASPEASSRLYAPMPTVDKVMPVQPTVSSKNYSELELAAYRRAELAERLARERATKVYEQVASVFSGATARFDSSEHDLDQLCKNLQLNVDQLLQLLYGIRCAYTETQESFQAVGTKNREQAEAVDEP